ncbi:hypothetical protein JOF56_007585 [Kibdelosporangium banguiense]|uniref:Lipoprotein n=1 Tax=Kibdelosporangium banguiense TaxID=1365924 RepID=A0ABS4TT94_9PSEU|nr:hypothetical protein [Kibdelosporangium banguiense]MBP2327200.1 hypothetical protein [Kibdelosporangium banguiense]
MTVRQVFGRIVITSVTISLGVLMFHACTASLRASGATVYQFFHAVGVGDAPAACHLLSGAALAKFQARAHATSCEAAVTLVHRGLTPAKREELVTGEPDVQEYITAVRLDFSTRREITFDPNPLGMEYIVLADHEGRETISDWGWDVRELS